MICIVILNYCSINDVKSCIDSISATYKDDYQICIVDNNSPDNSGEDLEEYYRNVDNIVVILNKSNNGYAAGNNFGIKYALEHKFEYIIISNPDMIFHENAISNMITALKENESIGLVSPKILNHDNTVYQFGQGKKQIGIKDLYLLKYPIRKLNISNIVEKNFFNEYQLNENHLIYSASGCCFCLTSKAAKELYPLDENTFMYYEEEIIAWNLEKEKIKSYYCSNALVTHNHIYNGEMIAPFNLMQKFFSEIYYCRTYLGCSKLELLPIILYYNSSYLYGCIRNKKYRSYFKYFFKTTLQRVKKIV